MARTGWRPKGAHKGLLSNQDSRLGYRNQGARPWSIRASGPGSSHFAPTSFRIFGYPGLAMIFLLTAAAGGGALADSIVLSDRKQSDRRRNREGDGRNFNGL